MGLAVGTSSWADPGFVEEWYPPDLAAQDRLSWYAERFECVELNSSFYALPSERNAARWVDQTPDGFTFDVKVHRLLSRHAAGAGSLPKDMREEVRLSARGRVILDEDLQAELARRQLEAVRPLAAAGRLKSFLVQLTPAFSAEDHELAELEPLVQALAPHPVAIELRNRSWVAGEARSKRTLDAFRALPAAWVGVDAPRGDHFTMMPPVDAVTHPDLAYLRAHGRNAEGFVHGRTVAERFAYAYDDDELRELAGRATGLADRVADVRTQFNNNRGADAPTSARRFRELVGQDPGPVPVRTPAGPAQGTLL